MSTSASSSSSDAPGLLAAAPVSARARRILEALHAQSAQALANPFKLTLVELERELFKHAERARNSQVQADLYAEMQRLREHAERFAPAMLAGMARELATLREPKRTAPGREAPTQAFQTLTLVEDTDIDRDIVLNEIARREASRATGALQLLSQRFGVLAALPAFELEQLPMGPHALCRVLRDAGETLALSLDSQLMLYRVFERQSMERLGEVLERANVLLAHEGVLPGLVYHPYVARPAPPRQRGPQAPGQPTAAQPSAAPGTPRGGPPRPLTSWSGQGGEASWQAATQAGLSAPAASAAATPPAAADLDTLRSLLGAARQQAQPATASPAGAAAAVAPVQPAALATALGTLQARSNAGHPAPPSARRSMGDLQQQLLGLLREAHGPEAGLSPQDTDTFDLLGLLYGEIEREVRSGTSAAELLVRLQVPVVRAALQDRAFFVRDQHPARELLNAVAESGATWLADDDGDPQLLQKLGRAVDKVVAEYQGDEAVFEHANEEIQAHHKAQVRKAEVSERRHVEAARGKERLEMAKRLAGDSIDHVCATAAPPKFVQALLRQAWSDVLTLTLLRHGEQSPEWEERQALTDRVAEVTGRPSGGDADAELGSELEAALAQVGYHQDEAAAIARRLSTPGGEDAATSRTELAAKLKARARLGENPEARREPVAPRSPAEQACYGQLRTLPFGTWFEFVTNQQGDARRQRLSWYSLVTDHALFVNQRGQKIGEHTLDGLARLMAAGQVRLLTEDRGRLIDRAWQATVRALRALAGGRDAATAQERPA